METRPRSDLRIGYSLLFGLLGLLAAFVMLATRLSGDQVLSGYGFAAAMFVATLLVSVLHLVD
jgi:uncharacterized membrane protein (DUF485 family)